MGGSQNVYMLVQDNAGNMDAPLWQLMSTYIPAPIGTPSVISISPSSGGGTSQQFTGRFSHTQGADKIGQMFTLFSSTSTPNGTGSCFLYHTGSLFNLLNDANTAWLASPNYPASEFPIGNSICTISNGSVTTPTAFQKTMTSDLTFTAGATPKTYYTFLYGVDIYGQATGWQSVGTWTIPASAPTVSISITPNATQQMTSGSANSFAATVTGASNQGVTWSLSQNGSQATLTANGNNATVTVTSAAVTPEMMVLTARSIANQQATATVYINIQPANPIPSLMSVSSPPINTLVGNSIPYYITFGATDITASQIDWIQPVITPNYPIQATNPGCHLLYYSATSAASNQANDVWLFDDNGNYQIAWTPIGAGGATIFNNNCTVDGANSTVTTSGDGKTLQLTLRLTFSQSMTGYQNVFMTSANHQYWTNWQYLGWNWKGYLMVQ
jgi:hypothetical protein